MSLHASGGSSSQHPVSSHLLLKSRCLWKKSTTAASGMARCSKVSLCTTIILPPKGRACADAPPYSPGSSFFFKVKFDKPYLMYCNWQEMYCDWQEITIGLFKVATYFFAYPHYCQISNK